MKTYDAKDIRNVLLVGHGGSGKTTLLEAMLYTSGAITRMGTVEDGNTVSDHDPDEQRKNISVSLSMAPDRMGRRQDQRAGRARLRRLHRRPAFGDQGGRRGDRGGVRGRRRRGPDRGGVGARGGGGPASRDLREQARPRTLIVPGHARSAGVVVRQPGGAARAPDRRRGGVRRPRRPPAREGRPLPERPDRGGGRVARRAPRGRRPLPREADGGRGRGGRRADREVPGGGHALRGGDRRRA